MAEGALDGVRVLDLTWGARGKRTGGKMQEEFCLPLASGILLLKETSHA